MYKISSISAYAKYINAMPDAKQGITTISKLVFIGCLILIAGIFFVLLVLSSARQNIDVDKGTHKVSSMPTLDAAFFKETEVGRILYSWLACEDACEDDLEAVIAHGSEAIPVLTQILQHGITPEAEVYFGGGPGSGNIIQGVRVKTINALGLLRDNRAIGPLIAILTEPVASSYPPIRAAVAGALSNIGGDVAFTTTVPLLKDKDDFVREVTAQALERFGRQEAIPALRTAAQVESKAHVRRAIEKAISTLEQR